MSREVSEICTQLGIQDVNETNVPKSQIKTAVFNHHYTEMMEEIKKCKKMEQHKDDDFQEVQSYFKWKNLEKTRMAFRVRCELVDQIRGNFKSKFRRNGGEGALICTDCAGGDIQTQSHCMNCPRWSGLRVGLDLTVIDDLTIFFQKLLLERGRENLAQKSCAT